MEKKYVVYAIRKVYVIKSVFKNAELTGNRSLYELPGSRFDFKDDAVLFIQRLKKMPSEKFSKKYGIELQDMDNLDFTILEVWC